MRFLKRLLAVSGIALVGGYIVLALALAFLSRRFIFPVPPVQPLGRMPPGIVHIPSCGAARVPCVYAAAAPGQPTLVFFHGNGDQLATAVWLAETLRPSGVGLFAVEYPGYSGSPGTPSERSLYAAAEGATAYLRDTLKVPASQTVLLGQSLGTGVATELAHRGIGARLILVSPFTSIPDVGQRVFPFLPARLLVRDRFDSLSKAPSIEQPTLILHGTVDEVVPFDLGERLARAIPHATFVPVPGAGHNDMLDRPALIDAIARFARDGAAPGVSARSVASP